MFEETEGTARSLTASQKISSPWHTHSAGTAPATAWKQEGWVGGTIRRGEKKYSVKEQWAQRQT